MKQKKILIKLTTPTFLSIFLTACGGGISNVTPDPNTTLYIEDRDTVKFTVNGTKPGNISRHRWVRTTHKKNGEISFIYLSDSNGPTTTHTMPYKTEEAANISITVNYQIMDFNEPLRIDYFANGFFPSIPYKTLESETWEFKPAPQQEAPIWEGQVFIRNLNDLEPLEGFSTINGNLMIDDISFSLERLELDIDNVEGDLLVTNTHICKSELEQWSDDFAVAGDIVIEGKDC